MDEGVMDVWCWVFGVGVFGVGVMNR